MTAPPYVIMDSPNSKQWFQKCCFCIPLRIGTLIMAYLALAYAVLVTIALSGSFIWIFMATNGFSAVETTSEKYPSPKFQRFYLGHYAAVLSFLTVFHIFSITLIITCLVGIHKRRPDLIHWHISFTATRFLVMIAALGYNFLLEVDYIILIIQLFDIGFTCYYLTVLYVYMGQLIEELAKEKAINGKVAIEKVNSNEKNGSVFKIPNV